MEPKKMLKIGFEGMVFVAVLAMLGHRMIPAKPIESSKGAALSYSLTALDGTTIPNEDIKGQAVVLNFWAPWCPPCKMEIPWLQRLQNDNIGKLRVIGVVADDGQYDNAAAYMKAKGITYLLARDSSSLQNAFGDTSSLPTTFYISPSGHVVHMVSGLVPEYMIHQYASDAIRQR